jgi:hypothetical protein
VNSDHGKGISIPSGLIGSQLQTWKFRQELAEGDAGLRPGQRRTQAEVDAAPEKKVGNANYSVA